MVKVNYAFMETGQLVILITTRDAQFDSLLLQPAQRRQSNMVAAVIVR